MSTRIAERSRQTHVALIRALASEYENQGYYVNADHINHLHGSPPRIGGHTPDVTGYSDNTLRIVAEAETCDTIADMHTREQWEAFSQSPYLFDIIVPKSCLEEAQRQAYIWAIKVNRWWWLRD